MSRGVCWGLWILLCAASLAEAASCPSVEPNQPCLCTSRAQEIQIWCNGADGESVGASLGVLGAGVTGPVDELILESNSLTSLPSLAPLRVLRIMLRDNKLRNIPTSALIGLEEYLLEVFVVEPELRELGVISGLQRLEALTLEAGLHQLPSLAGLTRLRYLYLRLPLLTHLRPHDFIGLQSLEELHIVGSPLLPRLEAGIFKDMPRLVRLNLSECGIKWVHPRAMSRLPSLKELDLSGNKLEDAGEVGRSIRELPLLTSVRLEFNRIRVLGETSFVDIPPLRELSLASNEISEIARGAFHRLPSLRSLDLSHNRIRALHPEFFLQPYDSGLEELILTHNEINHVMYLRIILDVLPMLRFLDLSHNRLADIMFGSMRGHPTLERLHLDHNMLKRVVREAFTAMPALRELRLRNNSLSNYLEMPLWNLPALKGLDISHNEFRRLDRRVLANLPSLRSLDVSNNALVVVDPASFLGTPALETLNLSHNAIESVSPITLAHLAGLFELDVGHNRLREVVPGLPRALEHLHMPSNRLASLPRPPSPQLLLPSLRTFDITGNILQHLPPEGLISMPLLRKFYVGENALQSLDDRALDGLGRLEVLNLRNNRILKLHDNSLRDLRKLQELDLHGNRLERVQSTLLRENRALKKLDLSHNQLTEIIGSAFENNKEMKELLLSHNALGQFPTSLTSLPELESLDLSHNRIEQLGHAALSGLKALSSLKMAKNRIHTLLEGTFSNMPNLTTLDLESNEIQFITPHAVRSMPALLALRMSRNKLSAVPSAAFSDLPNLLQVELQENQLTHLASDSFSGVPNLLMLNLSYNQLTGMDRAGLNGLKSLEILDLSHNKLSRLNTPATPNLNSLVQLKIDNNRICNIQGSPFTKMSHLRMLSLRNNKLTSLSESIFAPVRNTMYHLDIEGNPLHCSCSMVWLRPWIPGNGPRCLDGSYLKELRISRQTCVEPKRTELVPGCEETPNVLGPPQIVSTLTDNKNSIQRPSPEESEYFYEEYVEYEENVTLPFNISKHFSSTTVPPPSVTSIPPGVLSHYTPGDTPTLYAATKPGSDEGKNQKPTVPGATFTFFGMPLPSLGSFWGSSRNADGKGRFSGAKGRVQHIPGSPQVEKGFVPILPSTGGFRPIFNPFINNSEKYRRPSNYSNIPSASFPQATISKVVPPKELRPLEINQIAQLTAMSEQQINVSQDNKRVPSLSQEVKTTTEKLFQFNRLEPSLETTTPFTFTSPEDSPRLSSSYPQTTKSPQTSTSLNHHFSPTDPSSISSEDQSSENESAEPTLSLQAFGNKGPSSLSGLLAPGGQLPPYKPPGRPTITKVESLGAGPAPVAEGILGPAPRQPKSPTHQEAFPPRASSTPNPSIAWYYNNYNNSNLEPFVGPSPSLTRSRAAQTPSALQLLVLASCIVRNCS